MGGWFGSSSSGQLKKKSPAVQQMEQQVEMMDMVFKQSVSLCGQKCISSSYRDGELNKGEAVCTKRCVSKFFESLEVIGNELSEIGGGNIIKT